MQQPRPETRVCSQLGPSPTHKYTGSVLLWAAASQIRMQVFTKEHRFRRVSSFVPHHPKKLRNTILPNTLGAFCFLLCMDKFHSAVNEIISSLSMRHQTTPQYSNIQQKLNAMQATKKPEQESNMLLNDCCSIKKTKGDNSKQNET